MSLGFSHYYLCREYRCRKSHYKVRSMCDNIQNNAQIDLLSLNHYQRDEINVSVDEGFDLTALCAVLMQQTTVNWTNCSAAVNTIMRIVHRQRTLSIPSIRNVRHA